jgi:hypothetical protein
MVGRMTQQSDIHTLAVKVGEISGQLREVIHTQGNMAQKLDSLVERGFKAATTEDIERLARRIDALESKNDRDDGAKGVWAAILQSRFAAWVAATLGAAYIAIDKGLFK